MRGLGVVGVAGVAACTMPNPAWLVTESSDASSAGGSTAAADATGATGATDATDATSVGGTTTAGTSTTAVTTGGTGPATSEPATSTSGPDMTTSETTGVDACLLPVVPDIELTFTTGEPVVCDVQQPRTMLAEVLGKAAANQWKFNVCADEDACVGEEMCAAGEHVIFTFEGPQELMPTFVPGECHEIHLLARKAVDGDLKSCALRLLRFAHTRYMPFATHYVGATAVPGTAGLPGMVDWLKVIGFEVSAKIAAPCEADPLNCQPPVGSYDFVVKWDDQTEYTVGEGGSFGEQFMVFDEGQAVAIEGAFTDVRSRIELGVCGTRQDFKWVWLAALPEP
jgi:hypothetical protein